MRHLTQEKIKFFSLLIFLLKRAKVLLFYGKSTVLLRWAYSQTLTFTVSDFTIKSCDTILLNA